MADGSDPLFSLDVVRDFIVSRGGKVSNHQLVSHFKHFLNDPRRKVANRQKFKTFVNTLASVKLDASGEKLLVLKRKFREGIYSSSGSTGAASGEAEGGDVAAETQNVPPKKAKVESAADAAEPTEDVDKDTVPAGAEAASGTEQESEETVDKASQEAPQTTETGQDSAAAGADVAETDEQTTESSASVASDDGVFVDAVEQLPAAKEDTEASAAAEAKDSSKEPSPAAEVSDTVETSPSTEGCDSVFSEIASEAESLPSPDDVAKAAVEAAMAPDVVEEKEDSTEASNESDVPVTPVKQAAGEEGTTNTPMSVKERARHLNRMESQTELEKTTPTAPKTPKEFKPSERRSTEEKDESQTSGSVSLDSTERQWLVLAATTDYHPMAKILLTNAHLVKQKDFTSTALHWAAKHGKPEVVKLLCGTPGSNVNARSGYTPLHLATMNRHEPVIEMLVQVYGANPNIRDYSGKKAKQYLSNTMSSHTQQILQSRRSTVAPKSQSEDPALHRVASDGSRIYRGGQGGISATSTVRGMWKHHSATPSPAISPAPSPVIARKGSLPDRPDMMPPPRHLPSMRSRKRSKNQNKDVPLRSHSESPHMWKRGSEPELRKAGSSVIV